MIKKIIHFVAVLGLAILSRLQTSFALQATAINGVYTGTLGGQAVVVELGITGDEKNVAGRYFYHRHGMEIALTGEQQADGKIHLQEIAHTNEDNDVSASGAEWLLTFKNGTANGIFCKCKVTGPVSAQDKTSEVTLTRVSTGFDPSLYEPSNQKRADQAYFDLLLQGPVSESPEVTAGPAMAYVIRKDKLLGASMPRLTRFPDAAIMQKVNALLARRFANERILSAQTGEQDGTTNDDDVKVTLLTRDVLCVTFWNSYYTSGTAHPDASFDTVIYDMRNGREVKLDSFFNGRKLKPDTQGGHDTDDLDDSSECLAGPDCILSRFYMAHYKPPNQDCRVNDVRGAQKHAYLVKTGIAVEGDPNDGRNVMDCTPLIVVPYKELRSYLKPDSPISGLVEADVAKK